MPIELPATVERELLALAVTQRRDIHDLVEEAVRLYLEAAAITRRAQAEPAPLPLLRDPVLVAGIDLDDTSRLWELE